MTTSTTNREASATIRGYIYQFDATIRKILASSSGDFCTVENIEDFDIHTSNLSSYFQCKYYAAQKLTSSILRDAILPMLKNYASLGSGERENKRYYLYGYFKESSYESSDITFEILKSTLVRRETLKGKTGGKYFRIINIQEEIGVTDNDIKEFVKKFFLEFGAEYEEHKATVIDEIASTAGVTRIEAEYFLYPSALTLISNLACGNDISTRKITRDDFIQRIQPNRALYSIWSLREKTQRSYCRDMRNRYFSKLNIDSEARFFVLEFPSTTSESDIKDVLLSIRKKWSSHTVRRKPDGDRYAPYVFLRNIPMGRLSNIKKTLHQDGCVFVDGYPFQGADFSTNSICQNQTYQNKISLRFINRERDLRDSLNYLSQSIKVFQFFTEGPLKIEKEITQVCIPITSPQMIVDIL